MPLSEYQGITQFGRAYQFMLENDAHAPGSVDRALMERMIRLWPATAAYLYREYTPEYVRYEQGSRPELERRLDEVTADCRSPEEQVEEIAALTASLAETTEDSLDDLLFGGVEEEIIRRGTDWCTDLARVACVLCQIGGLPSRILTLADTDQAYSGHSIVEVFRRGVWGAVDPTHAVPYRNPDGRPASAWELMNQPWLVEAHWQHKTDKMAMVGQFRCVAISNYFASDRDQYDYTVCGVDAYNRSILEMSQKGWPGGLRWLHGEDVG